MNVIERSPCVGICRYEKRNYVVLIKASLLPFWVSCKQSRFSLKTKRVRILTKLYRWYVKHAIESTLYVF